MSTQIDSLSIEIKSASQSATAELDALVKSLQRLKSLRTVANNLQKLAGAVEKGAAKFNNAASATNKFASSAGKAASSASSLGSSFKNATSGLKGFLAGIVGLNSATDLMSSSLNEAKDWSGISSRFGEGFGEQADEAYAHVQKLSDALMINDQAFMQYAGNFATLGKGFGVTGKNLSNMSIGLTELAYDIYAKSNDFYSFTEAMDAVRSAVVGEVEPIRKAGISITEAMLKETAAANGITQSVESMTEAQKAQLRYKAMVDQAFASSTVGTYASELGTAEGMLRTLQQQIRGVAQALGGLFIPALSAVLPYIQAFISLITAAINALALFFGFKIKSFSGGASDGLGSAADSAGKLESALGGAGGAADKLKGKLAGFDELNIIQNKSGGGGGGSGGALDDFALELESLWSTDTFQAFENKTKEITDKIVMYLQPLKDSIDAIDFAPIANSLSGFGEAVSGFISTAGWFLYWFLHQVLVPVIGAKVESDLPAFFDNLASTVGAAKEKLIGLWVWMSANKDQVMDITGKVLTFITTFLGIRTLKKIFPGLLGSLNPFTAALVITIARSDSVQSALQSLKDKASEIDFQPLTDSISRFNEALSPLVTTIGDAAYWFLSEVLLPLAETYIEDHLPEFFDSLADAVAWANEKFSSLLEWLKQNKDMVMEVAEKVLWFIVVFSGIKMLSTIVSGVAKVFTSKAFVIALGLILIIAGVEDIISVFNEWKETGNLTDEMLSTLSKSILIAGLGVAILTGNWTVLLAAGIVSFLIDVASRLDEMTLSISNWWEGIKTSVDAWVLQAKNTFSRIYTWYNDNIAAPIASFVQKIIDFFAQITGWCATPETKTITINKVETFSGRASVSKPLKSAFGVVVDQRASGGYVNEGQLFIAREAGPELVGSMNGRTAVANNDQIVEGIASGVAVGQAEQNALLRQQNNILMQLLNKNFTATVAPSAALGRVNAQSAAMYQKLTGV